MVFVSTQIAESVMGKYPSTWKDKSHVIPHGYDSELLRSLDLPNKPNPRLRMVYTGSFYQEMRTPMGLLRGLQALARKSPIEDLLELVFVGPNVDAYKPAARKLGLSEIVEFRGVQPFAATLETAATADVLILIDASQPTPSVFLPSKLIDYLMFRKPILGLTPSAGASADLLRRLECQIVPPDDVRAIADALSELLRDWQTGVLGVSDQFESVAREYDICATTTNLDRILKRHVSPA